MYMYMNVYLTYPKQVNALFLNHNMLELRCMIFLCFSRLRVLQHFSTRSCGCRYIFIY